MSEKKPFVFKTCTCGVGLNTDNTERVELNELGLWYSCKACQSTGTFTYRYSPEVIEEYKKWLEKK